MSSTRILPAFACNPSGLSLCGATKDSCQAMRHTSLHAEHLRLHARMVEFAGYEMPLHYGSQIDEHHAVRRAAGVFDVSHMGVVDVGGGGALHALSLLLANNPARLKPGRALYSCMLNEQGGVIDDLIVYQPRPGLYRLGVDAARGG